MDSSNQPPMVDRTQARADQVVAMARRHADEIRAAAEQEAERVLMEAEREALRRQEERLEADRRERMRIGVQRQHIEDCLDATMAAVTRMRELIASLPALEPSQTRVDAPDERDLPPAVHAVRESTDWRHRVTNGLAIVLAAWAIVMVVTLLVVSRKPADAEAAKHIDTLSSQPQTPQADGAQTPSQATAAAARVAVPVQSPDELGLTVAFVASRDCWISVTSDDGAPSDRMLKASERYVVRAREAVSFKAGNAGALSMLINDRPAAPLGAEGQVVARRITRTNYRSLLES